AKTPRPAATRLRVLAGALELASRIGATAAAELLAQVGPALDATAASTDPAVVDHKAILLERAFFFAAHYDRPELVRTFADRLGELLLAPAGRSALDPVGSLVGQSLRSLRKLGLKDQTERLLQQIAEAALGGRSLEQARSSV